VDKANKAQHLHEVEIAQLREQRSVLQSLTDARAREVGELRHAFKLAGDEVSQALRTLIQTEATQANERNACEKVRIRITEQLAQAQSEVTEHKMAVRRCENSFKVLKNLPTRINRQGTSLYQRITNSTWY
jgi:hypothetical protein